MRSLVEIKRELSRIDLRVDPGMAWLVRKEITNVISAHLIWELKVYSHRVSECSCANCNMLDCLGVLYEPGTTGADNDVRGFCTKHCDPIVRSFTERRDVRRNLDAIARNVELGRTWSARKNLTKLGRKYVRWIRSYPSDLLDDPSYPGDGDE